MWKCPKCGSTRLEVVVMVWATLDQDLTTGDFETDVDDADHEWDGESGMSCKDCGYIESARKFEVKELK